MASLKQLYPDRWQTSLEHPLPDFPEVISHAYLLVREEGNVLFYSTGREDINPADDTADLEHIRELGGIKRQYLCHWHEAVPAMEHIRQMFGAELSCYAPEQGAIRKASGVQADLTFREREMHPGDIEAIPTPGHTPGSACYLCKSPHGKTYLFTGDTILVKNDGTWENGYMPGGESSKPDLRESLMTLRGLEPDVIFPAASFGRFPFKEVSHKEWQSGVDEALGSLQTDLEELLSGYLAVCNRVLAKNKFWYRQVKRLNKVLLDNMNFRTIVYDQDPGQVLGAFTIRFEKENHKMSLLPPGDHNTAFAWKVPVRYLRDVVENRPEWYLRHPVKLDWKWLTTRISDETASRSNGRKALAAGTAGVVLGAAIGALSARYLRTGSKA